MTTPPPEPEPAAEPAAEPVVPTGESVDPHWWSNLTDGDGPFGEHAAPERLSLTLEDRAKRTIEDDPESLRARTLTALAKASSPMLDSENWAEPFKPAFQIGGRRSALPQDLTDDELSLLRRIAPMIDLPALRARVADVVWGRARGDQQMWQLAVESYFAIPLEADAWFDSGHDGYKRGVELALRRGKPGAVLVESMVADLLKFVLDGSTEDQWMLVDATDLIAHTGQWTPEQAQQVGEHVAVLAGTTAAPRTGRALARAATRCFRVTRDADRVNAMTELVAELYVEEAESRLIGDDSSAMVAGIFLEKAVATIRGLPRTYRTTHRIETWLKILQTELAELRQASIEEMSVISSDPLDIAGFVIQSQELVSGRDPLEALAALAGIADLIDVEATMASERDRFAGSLSRLMGGVTFSHDARKVAVKDGMAGTGPTDEQVFAEVVSSFSQRIELLVRAQIFPAHQVVSFEHNYDLGFLIRLCIESPWIPGGHERLWARGLQHGFCGDFPSAVSVLVPQIEELVRRYFKANGVYTLFIGDYGVEQEKSIAALLEMEESDELLGSGLTLELRALLCEQLGPNLRNDLAHGLLNDPQSWGSAAVYAWWHCLRLAVIPYWNMVRAAAEEGAGTTSEA